MDILEMVKGCVAKVSGIEKAMVDVWKEISKIKGTALDKSANLISGSYGGQVEVKFFNEHGAAEVTAKIHGSSVVVSEVMTMDDYAMMFKRDRRNMELFLLVYNIDPMNMEQLPNIKFEVKVAKGSGENMLPVIKSIHAIGLWREGEFIHYNEGK